MLATSWFHGSRSASKPAGVVTSSVVKNDIRLVRAPLFGPARQAGLAPDRAELNGKEAIDETRRQQPPRCQDEPQVRPAEVEGHVAFGLPVEADEPVGIAPRGHQRWRILAF